jgi:transcription factor MYB, plant
LQKLFQESKYFSYFTISYISFQVGFLNIRNDVQCREKWCNNLDPTININEFTNDEDEELRQLVNTYGEKQWVKIASHIAGRTDSAVRQRWNALKKKKKHSE